MDNMIQLKENFELITRSTEQYPVDFDQAWQWVGYSTKGNALRKLQENFEEGIDFDLSKLINQKSSQGVDFCLSEMISKKQGRGGHNQILYFLTVDCFKAFCMMAGTEKGKEVRKYYLRIEKEYRELLRQGKNGAFVLTGDILRELRLAWESKILSAADYRRIVLGKKTAPKIEELREEVRNFFKANIEFSGPEDYLPAADVYALYVEKAVSPMSRYKFTRRIQECYPDFIYKQKKIGGYPVLVFLGCKLIGKVPMGEAVNG
jgi:phage anti-repressor protein